MYQVLYRKWRPKVFADVVGQPQVTVTLKNELMSGRISHAYLFTGSRGTGKTTCAKILAKAVNCLNPRDGDPCGECEICRGIESGSIMDIVEIDAASNNGVDNIRSLREEANYTPSAAKYRAFIIDEVHMLSIGAFNALLKTLEEPPQHVIFILATTEVHKIPATILSRCQRFDFQRIPPQEIAGRLSEIAGREGAALEDQAALLLAKLSDGAMRDALSLLDQCLGRSSDVTVDVVTETVGLVGHDYLFKLVDAVNGEDAPTALNLLDQMYRGSKDMTRLCEELSSHYRGLMLVKTMKNAAEILTVTAEEYAAMQKQAGEVSLSAVLHCMALLQSTLERLYHGGDKRIEMEMTLLKLCTPALDASADALLRRIEALERGGARGGAPMKAAVQQRADAVEAPVAAAQNAAPEAVFETAPGSEREEPPVRAGNVMAAAEPFQEWPEILQLLKEQFPSVSAAFQGSKAYISGEYILIEAKDMAFELLRRPNQRMKMREAIQQVTGRVYKLGPYRPPQAEKETERDPLLELADLAAQAGSDVIQK